MKNKKHLKLGCSVTLKTFAGKSTAPARTTPKENYWRLIGRTGRVIQSPSQATLFADFSRQPRVLVQFDDPLIAEGVECHNEVPNSLWILVTDLSQADGIRK